MNHPCNAGGKAANYHLTDYDMTRMGTQLDDDLARLKRLGATTPFTFAYPCFSDKMGIGPNGQDSRPARPIALLCGARFGHILAHPKSVDLHHVSYSTRLATTPATVTRHGDQAIAQKGWLVLLFHGVGNETTCPKLDYQPTLLINYLVTSTAAHQALIEYLDQKKAQVWTATFKTSQQRRSQRHVIRRALWTIQNFYGRGIFSHQENSEGIDQLALTLPEWYC